MSNLMQIQSQIEKLQREAAELRTKEFSATVADIQAKMKAFGITIKDLQGKVKLKGGKLAKASKVPSAANKPRKEKTERSPVAAKYRGPNGETWTGRGLTPKWLSTLIAAGQSKEAFLLPNREDIPSSLAPATASVAPAADAQSPAAE